MKDVSGIVKRFIIELGLKVNNNELICNALIHPSFAQEKNTFQNNQRLEFLGDAVLDFVVAEYLYIFYPEKAEGELTQIRAKVVCEKALSEMALNINLGKYILLGKGEELSGGRKRKSILADTVEALIGAIYLDSGLEAARSFILKYLKGYIENAAAGAYQDYKSKLQEMVQAKKKENVTYKILDETGPAHARVFFSGVFYRNNLLASGAGNSKKESEQNAAEKVLKDEALIQKLLEQDL
jgi:ribonuclease-3